MELGHAQVRGEALSGRRAHGFKLLRGGGDGGFDRGDLAEPAQFLGLAKAIEEVGVDPLQPRD